MLELEKAIQVLQDAAGQIKETVKVPLAEASGRMLAEEIRAAYDQPPFDRSPLDGYAVRGEDTLTASEEQPVNLQVIGKIYAGQVYTGTIKKGQCVRLMTGSPIPSGANAVIRQEDTDYKAGDNGPAEEKEGLSGLEQSSLAGTVSRVNIFKGASPYQNYVYAGEDYHKGDLLLEKGTLLNGLHLGIIAGAGRDHVEVYREPVITVISTGDEVLAPGEPLSPGKIYDSNRFTVVGRLADLGFRKVESFHCQDQTGAMEEGIREATKNSDLIITTGGVSVGEKDIMHQVMEDLHGDKLFWRVNLKPGAPTLAFCTGEKAVPVICLTGKPYGVAVNFELLVRPILGKLSGNPSVESQTRLCRLVNDSPKRGCVRRFLRGVYDDRKGEARILAGSHASGTLSSMAVSSCLVEIPENGSGKAGDQVRIYLL